MASRLTTLGGLALHRDGVAVIGPAAQRRRLALLALLAASLERGVTRDVLIGYLWGESTEERARHSLDQALSEMRKTIGHDVVVRTGAGLRLNEAVLRSDVAELVEAARAQRWEEVVRLYTGPFLDGFHLDGAPEFDQWIDTERRAHARTLADALSALARAAASRGEHATAARWWRSYTQIAPLSAIAALELMHALVAAGDRAAALEHFREHERRVQLELGSEPDAEVAAYAARLRNEASVAAPRYAPRTSGDRLLDQLRGALAERYVVDGLLTRGGLMLTFAARDRADEHAVHLKIVRPDLSSMVRSSELLPALERLTRLRHPRLVPLLAAGQADGVVWLATASLNGETLRSRLARDHQLALRDALGVGADVSDALGYANDQGVLHLDLASKRVLFDATGACVSEIGLTRAIRSSLETGDSENTRVIVGATEYMSPEVAMGDLPPDGRSDVYSVACLVYHALAGTAPNAWGFGATGAGSTAAMRLASHVPPIGELRDGVPPGVERALMAGLARAAADRPTMPELRAALLAMD